MTFEERINQCGIMQSPAKLTLKDVDILELQPFQGFLHTVKDVLEAPSMRVLYQKRLRKPCG